MKGYGFGRSWSHRALSLFAVTMVSGALCSSSRAMPGSASGGMGATMHGGYGQPLASADLPVGTLTVKVVGARLEDKRVGVVVTLVADGGGAGAKIVRKTGSTGRARFDGLKVGSRHVAEIAASGRVLRSSVLVIPSQGGIRVLMSVGASGAGLGAKAGGSATRPTRKAAAGAAAAASLPGAAAASSSPQAASRPVASSPTRDRRALFLGDGTHLLGQLKEGKIIFMQVFQVVNRGQVPVDPGPEGIMLPLPSGVAGAAVAGEDKALATISKDRKSLRLTRALPPGRTTIRVNFAMSTDGARLDFRQRMGLPLGASLFAVTNNNALAVHGPVFDRREMRGDTPVFVFKAVPSGGFLEFTIDAIPFHDPLWRNLTLGATVLLLLWALVAGLGAGIRRRRREGRREELLDALADLYARRASGKIKKKRYDQDRQRLVDALRPLWDD